MKHFIVIVSLSALGLNALTACSAQTESERAGYTALETELEKTAKADTPKVEAPKMDHSKIVTGNGKNNYVILEGATRKAQTFTFPEVTLDKDGFLVMHPFKDGKPVQTEYVGAVPVAAGTHKDVSLTIDTPTQTGDNFVVMLHYDMNRDKIFDFNDGITVPDAPVFEGHTLIALRYTAP